MLATYSTRTTIQENRLKPRAMSYIARSANLRWKRFFITQARLLTKKQRALPVDPFCRELSLRCQCEILSISRSSYYYKLKPMKPEDLNLMRKIDELYTDDPSRGSRSMRRQLGRQGLRANRKPTMSDDEVYKLLRQKNSSRNQRICRESHTANTYLYFISSPQIAFCVC